jgi:hypothetical protein
MKIKSKKEGERNVVVANEDQRRLVDRREVVALRAKPTMKCTVSHAFEP